MTEDDLRAIAEKFAAAVRTQDREALSSITTSEVTWTLPGNASISGVAAGVDGILKRAQMLSDHQVNIKVLHVVYGLFGFGLLLHNTGRKGERVLDEHLTTIMQMEGDRIDRLDTYISDVAMLEAYFAED
ncbi:nuclear transport factor 2 family protein [Caulobacter sp. S45]|uniref:nuclear transport factor 2 family protein n=1 Tax=Caulobacter sp. S45 TaxID=1641861 RepID=UPI00131C5968|nr:nuclear transport factor 2 family protein [Caulobacter sp. S45]